MLYINNYPPILTLETFTLYLTYSAFLSHNLLRKYRWL